MLFSALAASSNTNIKPFDIGCDICLSWEDIGNLAEQTLGQDNYVTQRLRKAMWLYKLITPTNNNNKRNYFGKESLEEIIKRCQVEGSQILIGYNGGVKELESVDTEKLTKRQFKWDWSKDSIPPKLPRNWIKGDKFLEILKNKSVY